MADLIVDNVLEAEIAKHYASGYRRALLGNGYEAEGFFPHMGQEGCWLFFTAAPLRAASGEIIGALETLQDITDRRQAEDALAENRHWLSQIIQGNAVPTFVIDRDHRISEWNLACEKMTGFMADQMIGTRNQWQAFSTHQRPVLADFILNAATEQEIAAQYGDKYRYSLLGEGYEVEDFFPTLGDDGKWLFFTASPLRDATGAIVGAIETLHVTRRRRAEDALRVSEQRYRELSITDDLTNLFNARYLNLRAIEEIDRAERYNRPLCLLMLDMDDFKSYNDTYGHLKGDSVLQRLAQTIRRCIRKTDSAFRYGGEEFTVLLPESTLENAVKVAERIRREFSQETFSPESGTVTQKTVSIGAAQLVPGEMAKTLLSRADRNLYRAKRSGKNRVDAGEGKE
jgi:diguanylate cyclase (GGDEF)-like protein